MKPILIIFAISLYLNVCAAQEALTDTGQEPVTAQEWSRDALVDPASNMETFEFSAKVRNGDSPRHEEEVSFFTCLQYGRYNHTPSGFAAARAQCPQHKVGESSFRIHWKTGWGSEHYYYYCGVCEHIAH